MPFFFSISFQNVRPSGFQRIENASFLTIWSTIIHSKIVYLGLVKGGSRDVFHDFGEVARNVEQRDC